VTSPPALPDPQSVPVEEDGLGAAVQPTGGEPAGQPGTTIVVGVAPDPAADAALRFAVDLAGRLAARLAVVHVVGVGDYPVDPDAADWEQQAQAALADERAEVERVLAGHAFGWSYRARRGPPAAVLATAAEEHDAYLIVVGRHEHTIGEQLRRLIDGSTSHSLLDRCGRPVLVVPAEH
jgi:nucleotide-binding universal stress UspA family protein